MEFLEAPAFTRYLSSYLSDDGYRELQHRLASAPELGDVISGTGGFRKVRMGGPQAWQRPQRRSAGDLLLFHGRTTDLADDALRQERGSFRPEKSKL